MDKNLPVLLLKKLSLLPSQEVRLELNNELSKKIIDTSISKYDKKLVVILPKDISEESLGINDLPKIGVLATIKSSVVLPNSNYRVVLKGLNRLNINSYSNFKLDKSILIANAKMIYIDNGESNEMIALKKKVISLLKKYIASSTKVSNSVLSKINDDLSLDELTDVIVNFMKFSLDKKILYMNEFDEVKRAKMLIKDINIELEVISLDNKIDNELRLSLEEEQKEYLIRQKINKLNEELGITSTKEDEVHEYQAKINILDTSDKVKNKLLSEVKRYEYTPSNNPEISIIRSYLDIVLSLPFNKSLEEESNIKKISDALNKSHYKMDNVKSRIIEYASLKKNNPDLVNPIICLIGAPGVGKSTIASSIAAALKRDFYKISVGGLNDSSELIGHRKTYLGAAPGKIIDSIIKCKSNNPVILIDEVDKMVKDYKGDPASVLLDILDSNLNKTFVDNYIEEEFDLSKVLFILTANNYDDIPNILRDRLEVIYIDNYSLFDKKDIAVNYLIPNICKKYNVKKITIDENQILNIIRSYTYEVGVRELERVLDKVIRYKIINNVKSLDLSIILGKPLITYELEENNIGEVNLIAVSNISGSLVKVSSVFNTLNEDIITGNIGEELTDSIKIIITYLTKNKYFTYLRGNHLHLHFDTHKYKLDGSSGSLGIACALCSLSLNKVIPSDTAFLGTVNLYGKVKSVNKLKEKIITSYNLGIKNIYLSNLNKEINNEIPKEVLENINLIYVSDFKEVYDLLFKK